MNKIDSSPFATNDAQAVHVRPWNIIIGTVVGIILLPAIFIGMYILSDQNMTLPVLVTAAAVLLYAATHPASDSEKAMAEFVRLNDMKPLSSEEMRQLCPPSVASRDMNRTFRNGYAMQYGKFRVCMFEVELRKNGKKRVSDRCFVMVVVTGENFPHIFFDCIPNGVMYTYVSNQRLSLEGNFNDYFDIYFEEGKHADTLAFVAPDVMTRLIDSAVMFDLETYDNNLAIINPLPFPYTKTAMDNFDAVLSALTPKLREPDQSGLNRRPEVASSGGGLKVERIPAWVWVVTAVIIAAPFVALYVFTT